MAASEYIKYLLSVEEYSFSFDEVLQNTSKDHVAVRREINRLIQKREILNLRHGFYVIIPPRYSRAEKLPIQLYSEKLMASLGRKYYIALYSAAKIHGASHQQIQKDYLMTEGPKLNTINKHHFHLQFHTTSTWPEKNIETKQSDAGIYRISSPVLTFVDLIHYQNKIGGLNRVLAPLEELIEEITENDLEALLTWYSSKSTLQRAGYLLEEVFSSFHLADMIYETLHQQSFYPVLLYHTPNASPGSTKTRWKIDVNLLLESDL